MDNDIAILAENGTTSKEKEFIDSNSSNIKGATNDAQIDNTSTNGIKNRSSSIVNDKQQKSESKPKAFSATQNGTSTQDIFPNRISTKERVPGTIPMKRQDLANPCGWGYKDTIVNLTAEKYSVSSDRYGYQDVSISEEIRNYLQETYGINFFENNTFIDQKLPTMPEPLLKKEFMSDLEKAYVPFSIDGEDRRFHSHGQKPVEIFLLKSGRPFQRYVDLVVWPSCHEDVVRLVEMANVHNVVIIPFGGGTCVSKALLLDSGEKRMIVSLDTSQMDQMLWIDKANMIACFQAGVVGQDIEKELEKHGLCCGNEPDSMEFSSLGGWIATRASGMKKNRYGNIEDIVCDIRFVTSKGTLEKSNQAQRISCGPDFNHVVLGSEGSLGVVTEATVKIRPLPEVKNYNSYVFPDFSCGIKFMQEVAEKRWQPAALRLIDNEQYLFGKLLKAPIEGYIANFMENMKMYYLSRIKGIQENAMAVVIVVFEGTYDEVKEQQYNIYTVAMKHGGVQAGAAHGERGYILTFVVSYIRDMLMTHWVIGDSLETSVSWDRCDNLVKNVKRDVKSKAKELGIKHCVISARVSQVYDTGCCVYLYILYNFQHGPDPAEGYQKLERAALQSVMKTGGSISHHHGIGKSKRDMYPLQVSDMAVKIFKSIKKEIDPKDIFAIGNIIPK